MPRSRRYIGHVEAIEPVLTGWVIDRNCPERGVSITALIDGAVRFVVIADQPRPDVAAAGHGALNCGFALALPVHLLDGRAHEFEMTAADAGPLELPGWHSPIVFGPLNSVVVSAVGAGDLGEVAALLRATHAESGLGADSIDEQFAAIWIGWFVGPPGGLLLGAWVERRLIGYAGLEAAPEPATRLGAVAINLLRAYRRKGLGERLLRALLDKVRERSEIREVWLSVAPENLPARRLYEKLGFVQHADPPPSLSVPADYLAMRWHGNRPLP